MVLGLLCAATGPSAQQPQAPTVAGQPPRTVQVLTDVPTPLMIPTMRVISASLGVECEFCHESNRTLNTAKKDVARRMMTMTRALNASAFSGQTRVTCYTCHRGSNNPLAAPVPTGNYTASGVGVLFKGTGSPVPGGQDAVLSARFKDLVANEQSSLPAPDQILAKYVSAIGGEQAWRRLTARRITATTEVAADVRGVGPAVHALTQQYFSAPNQWVVTSQTGAGTTTTGFDGSVAWRQDAKGVVTETTGAVPAPPLARVKRNADFFGPLNLRQAYSRVVTRGVVKVGDRDAYLVVGFPEGDLPEQLYFDVQSGLLVRKGTATATAFGDYAIQTDFEDYRDVDGVKLPYIVRTIGVSPADAVTTYIERVEHNPTLDPSRFLKPSSK
jgi:hypothetical protein